jgi:outer membrane protein
MRSSVLVCISMMIFSSLQAQQLLTIDDAVSIALKNNFDILIAKNDADVSKINNTIGNAGMLPDIKLSGNGSYESNNIRRENSDNSITEYNPMNTKALNAGAELNWTLFDGGKMFVTKSKLSQIEVLGDLKFKEQVLQTTYEVIAAYYDIVRQKQQLASINEVMNFNSERVKIAQTGFTAGSLVKTDLLQAKIDLNVTLENAIHQQYVIDAARKKLNTLLSKEPDEQYEVSDSIPNQYLPDTQKLIQRLDSVNTSILAFQKQVEISKLIIKENQSAYFPTVNFKAGYYLDQIDNSEGQTLNSNSSGPMVRGSVVLPLFTSGDTKRKINTAKIEFQSAQYQLQQVKIQKNTELKNALTDFENQKQLLEIEKENNELTRENLEISLQRLRLGQTNSLEVHQAQDDYVQSCTRLINFQYNLKIAEINLKQLVADL